MLIVANREGSNCEEERRVSLERIKSGKKQHKEKPHRDIKTEKGTISIKDKNKRVRNKGEETKLGEIGDSKGQERPILISRQCAIL